MAVSASDPCFVVNTRSELRQAPISISWYGLFPGERPLWQTLAVGAGLAVALSFFTTFSGILADPLQARLGIHRRRLVRLLRRIDRAAEERPRIEGEFVLARGADIVDVATMVIRSLRS